jgi:hypothetical protein
VSDGAVVQWQERHGRELNATERYAVAKMSLFQAFDERDDPAAMREDVAARAADLEAILESLDIG